jgi:mannose-6-phosphate isomerase-like protein (cupin superfamily)
MRTGHVQEYIDGKHYPAGDGDLIFLPSGSSHALENHSTQRAEYFALQWQL